MGIRGDMEARYWREMGRDKPRAMVEHFFDCLKDPNLWQRLQRELDWTDAQALDFLEGVDWAKEHCVTAKPEEADA